MLRSMLALPAVLALAPLAPVMAQTPAPAAAAQPTPEQLAQARSFFIAGSEAYRDNKYSVAIEAFDAAFRLAPRGSVMFALAQAQRLQYFVDGQPERLEKAVELYRQYIERDDTDSEQSALAVRHLASLVPQLQRASRKQDDSIGRLIISANIDGAMVRIGDQAPVEAPAAFEVPPGTVQVVVEAPGYAPQTRDMVAVGGSGVALNVELVPLPGTLLVRTDEGAEIQVDGRSMGRAPLPPTDLTPGPHRVVVLSSGRSPFVSTVEVAATREVVVEAPLEQTGQRVAAWAMFGVGGALAATAAITGVLALQEQDAAETLHDEWRTVGLDPAGVEEYRSRLATRDDWVLRATVVGVGAAVAAGLGAALWLLDDPTAPNAPVLVPTVSTEGAGVLGRITF